MTKDPSHDKEPDSISENFCPNHNHRKTRTTKTVVELRRIFAVSFGRMSPSLFSPRIITTTSLYKYDLLKFLY